MHSAWTKSQLSWLQFECWSPGMHWQIKWMEMEKHYHQQLDQHIHECVLPLRAFIIIPNIQTGKKICYQMKFTYSVNQHPVSYWMWYCMHDGFKVFSYSVPCCWNQRTLYLFQDSKKKSHIYPIHQCADCRCVLNNVQSMLSSCKHLLKHTTVHKEQSCFHFLNIFS